MVTLKEKAKQPKTKKLTGYLVFPLLAIMACSSVLAIFVIFGMNSISENRKSDFSLFGIVI